MAEKERDLLKAIEALPKNKVILDNFVKAWYFIKTHDKILCSISGGSDSDVMLDIIWRCDIDNKVDYVWFNTGLEYQATKQHLDYLEKRYGIEIRRERPKQPIPYTCKHSGQPFMNKHVSEMMMRLQKHGFQWEDESYDILVQKYTKCKSALAWWCNEHPGKSMFNINNNKLLKEFIVQNPPQFRISNLCCKYAKKNVAHRLVKEGKYDLNITGVRKAEGGVRATTYKSCFDDNDNGCDNYRPLFWYTNEDKQEYEMHFGIIHSKCYTEYGLKRTGCVGCPFGRHLENEIQVLDNYEPKLSKAVKNVFKDSYEYARQYKIFRETY